MNGKFIGFLLVFLLISTVAPACGTFANDINTPAQENTQLAGDAVKTASFTLNIYYRGTVSAGYVIDNSYRQFSDLVQGMDSYDLGEGRNIRVTIYKGSSKYDIDYRKVTAMLFADGKQVAGGTTLDESGRIVLAYEVK